MSKTAFMQKNVLNVLILMRAFLVSNNLLLTGFQVISHLCGHRAVKRLVCLR